MNLLTTAARTWLTRSPEPFRFTADNDAVLDYDDCPGLGLYVHIPFCRTLCNSRNVNHISAHRQMLTVFFEASHRNNTKPL